MPCLTKARCTSSLNVAAYLWRQSFIRLDTYIGTLEGGIEILETMPT